jgi:hypothetical protein
MLIRKASNFQTISKTSSAADAERFQATFGLPIETSFLRQKGRAVNETDYWSALRSIGIRYVTCVQTKSLWILTGNWSSELPEFIRSSRDERRISQVTRQHAKAPTLLHVAL